MLDKIVVENLLIICINKNRRKYHLIIVRININYKKLIVITGIK